MVRSRFMKTRLKQLCIKHCLWLIIILGWLACSSGDTSYVKNLYQTHPGFNAEGSDSLAIDWADKVFLALGGKEAWNNTRYIKWNFLGTRRHIWDKETNNIIIESLRDSVQIRMNIDQMEGTVNYKGTELTKSDSLDKYLQKGKEMWINDSYWLFMPYKLKDPGVTLHYAGLDTTTSGTPLAVIEITFDGVGVTPDNKYRIYIDQQRHIVLQWDFFTHKDDEKPRFSSPWEEYRRYGDILLSGSRGGNRQITEIAVGDSLSYYFEIQ